MLEYLYLFESMQCCPLCSGPRAYEVTLEVHMTGAGTVAVANKKIVDEVSTVYYRTFKNVLNVVCPSVCLPACLYISLSLSLCLSVCLSVYLSVSLSVCLSYFLFRSVYLYYPIFLNFLTIS